MIKLVAIDLDGTLLTDDKRISQKNLTVLQKAKEQGVKVVLCTGRPLAAITPFIEQLGLNEPGDYSITFNGGLVQENDTGEILSKSGMTLEDVQRISQLMIELDLPLDVLSEEVVLQLPTSTNHPSIYPELNGLLTYKPAKLADLTSDGLYNKVVMAYHQEFLDQQIEKIPVQFKADYEVIKTRSNLLEFMPKGVTKAFGLDHLAQYLGMTSDEVMALGDEENDLSMIQYAGMGVAMANAVEKVRQAADYITSSNEEDGVAKAVEKFVLK